MKNLELSLMMTDYHRTHPLFSGAVSLEGARLNVCPPPVQGDACYKPVYEQFDIAEMSLSWYVMARCRGEPLIAIPVFPLPMSIQPLNRQWTISSPRWSEVTGCSRFGSMPRGELVERVQDLRFQLGAGKTKKNGGIEQ